MNLMADSGAILRTLMPLPRQSDRAPPSRIIWVNPPTMHMLLLREACTWGGKDKGQEGLPRWPRGSRLPTKGLFSPSAPEADRQALPGTQTRPLTARPARSRPAPTARRHCAKHLRHDYFFKWKKKK